jgi:Flp pilus assembly protein TadB
MVGVINSVLIGAVAGFAVAAIVGDQLWASVLAGVVVFAIAVVLQERYQLRARYRKPDPFANAPQP